ncbi:hypothetical protein ACIO14_17670 [Nocardia fluminea]
MPASGTAADAVFEAQRELLRPLAAVKYLGPDDGAAQVFYQVFRG